MFLPVKGGKYRVFWCWLVQIWFLDSPIRMQLNFKRWILSSRMGRLNYCDPLSHVVKRHSGRKGLSHSH